ncbi:sensor domain-containing diguanylate cyclase [Clostridium beijerinckii]|uniref:Diguanylate cyclase (GGDEF)-like protein n=2 Tax=Clostridium beijerinckii TaxID=1520 RepID=A0A9Q5D095_CLOBE|nr:GGDEF domain-containing protein [Clostridium beijerinckii]AQS05762.1 response regulator PleD [Clostridium beijerinckii]MBA2885393.1 diguanylate cyclase (GGDEF)-like protein [Clostridium beijerinckii]MBA2900106.1 diguanylate cyclase (GGDEF)-like protein [Clostridium beijerinckii]MBA2909735.1 diguanylate cyclase (GGDEF)-like protein [Clostridium beijerinckii]MBA9014640.1 diguanylate cyclase (GGDEF)-like protein [Clostridium beijerinckii]
MKKNVKISISTIFVSTILFMLYLISLYNYLLFHTIAEIFSICIAFTVFLMTWNSAKYIKNKYLIIVGIAYLFIGILDLFHTLSYKGMEIFKDYDYYANQLWIAARYFESIVLIISFANLKSKTQVNVYFIFGIYTIITVVLLLSIFSWRIFPVCFVDCEGLTSFKKISEYIICVILFGAILFLTKNKDVFDEKVYRLLLLSMIFTIISELAFTIYIDNYGFSNLVGHYFKIFSFYLVYKVIIAKGINEPYEIIFREMKQTEKMLFDQNCLLKNQATIDGLTGLYNHRYIYERLEEEIRHSSKNRCAFVVMILDIDHFKRINDTYGHLTGDKILKNLAVILKNNIGETDLVGRYGGEEFLIMLTDTYLNDGFEVAEKIRKVIENMEFMQNIRLTISIGIEEYSGEKVSELLEKADIKLYKAKNSGRNKTVM